MPAGFLVTVRLPPTTGLERDAVYNSFSVADPVLADPGDLMAEFYNGQTDSHDQICEYISPAISRTDPCIVKSYDLSGHDGPGGGADTIGLPVIQDTFILGEGTAPSLPLEVACVLSMRAGRANGNADRRRRGRIYIGPLNQNAISGNSGGMPLVANGLRTAMLDAATRLYTLTTGSWGVWSREDNIVRPVTEVAVDNEFDTQRRRGRDATERTRLAFP